MPRIQKQKTQSFTISIPKEMIFLMGWEKGTEVAISANYKEGDKYLKIIEITPLV